MICNYLYKINNLPHTITFKWQMFNIAIGSMKSTVVNWIHKNGNQTNNKNEFLKLSKNDIKKDEKQQNENNLTAKWRWWKMKRWGWRSKKKSW